MESIVQEKKLSPWKTIILGIQHVFAMFGATVLVPALTGLDPSVALFTAGVGTLIFHLLTKGKVPVFLGSSFAFITAISAVVADQGIAYAGGGIIVAGLLYLVLAGLVLIFGVDRIRSFFPPLVTGPMIMVIGLTLSPSIIINNIVGVEGSEVLAMGTLGQRWIIVLAVVVTMVVVSIFVKGFFRLVPILLGILVGYIVSILFGFVDFTPIRDASIFALPPFTLPKFDIKAISLIAPIAIVTFMEHIGDITTNGAVVGKDFFKDPGLHRTLIGDGVATMFAGLLGGPSNTTYSENTGVLAVTKVYDPFILRIAAVFAIALGLVGKIGALLKTIPAPVMGGVSILLFGMIASIGLRTLSEAKIDFSKSRNLIVVSLMLVMGLSGVEFTIVQGVTLSGMSLAAIIGVVLNKILPENI
ncbi:MAG TPA: purine/pyrimidine permease [Clostridiales bacterium]|mgnify:FL=1|jgi:uracil permease|nr:purine/pyrimidine permease [Clostridiales bacterium]